MPTPRACVLFSSLLALGPLAAQAPAWVAAVDALVETRLAAPDAVGFSVGIAQGGKVVHAKGHGLAEAEFRIAANETTCFRIGSVTKQFTAALVLRLVEQGKLKLDDGVGEHVPDFPLQDRKVTIRMLLDHSSGIPSYTDDETWAKTIALELSHAELLAHVAGDPFAFEPGTDWYYNNTGYYLLGMVLEKVHGKSYAQIVHDELCEPLQLTRTRHDSNVDLIENRAQGYTLQDGVRCNDDPLGVSQPGAAGALLSTGADLVRWSMALAGGKVVSAASYAQMTTPLVLPNGRNTGYGFGLMRGEMAGKPAIFHGGGINGFNSILLHVPDADLHVAVISNSEHANAEKLAQQIVRTVLGIEKFVAKDLPPTDELLALCAGDFRIDLIDMTLAITVDGRTLRAQGKAEGQGAFRLLWQGGLEFRAAFDHDVKLEFTADGSELTLHQSGGKFVGKRETAPAGR